MYFDPVFPANFRIIHTILHMHSNRVPCCCDTEHVNNSFRFFLIFYCSHFELEWFEIILMVNLHEHNLILDGSELWNRWATVCFLVCEVLAFQEGFV